MVGLSIVLEPQKVGNSGACSNKKTQVINKTAMIKPSPPSCRPLPPPTDGRDFQPSAFPAASFLDACFLCRTKLLPCKDIYMYKGDRAFCSEECRCRQIFMDEEESLMTRGSSSERRPKSLWASIKKPKPATTTASSSSSRYTSSYR
ncbi:hypothetical protein Nepgr_020620 [Nepenthes gracilis]|uniref:FLZ-type domain-containing protein n=1 Tax=Nepenthes gracilis TaxID=150966 RepID=A0AAD3XW89_NEPGR|nr:hypothetical protein Nepgr_020620 [Nepenthes gracilis]